MKNVNEAILWYYQVFLKRIKPLPLNLNFHIFNRPSEVQKNGELLFVRVATCLVKYGVYKNLK